MRLTKHTNLLLLAFVAAAALVVLPAYAAKGGKGKQIKLVSVGSSVDLFSPALSSVDINASFKAKAPRRGKGVASFMVLYTVSITDVASGAVVRTISGEAGTGSVSVSVNWDGTDDGGAVVADGAYLYEVSGDLVLSVSPKGKSGRKVLVMSSSDSLFGSVLVDGTGPLVMALTPETGSTVDNSTPTFSAVFSDNLSGVDVGSVMTVLDGGDVTADSLVSADGFEYTPEMLQDGLHVMSVDVSDLAGNSTTAMTVIDVQAGEITILYGDSNQDGVFNQDDFDLLMSWLSGAPAPVPGEIAFIVSDVDGDILLSLGDAIQFFLQLNGAIEMFPVEQ